MQCATLATRPAARRQPPASTSTTEPRCFSAKGKEASEVSALLLPGLCRQQEPLLQSDGVRGRLWGRRGGDASLPEKFPGTRDEMSEVCKNGVNAAVDEKGIALDCASCPRGFSCEAGACCAGKKVVCEQTYDAGKFGSGGSMTPRSVTSSPVRLPSDITTAPLSRTACSSRTSASPATAM